MDTFLAKHLSNAKKDLASTRTDLVKSCIQIMGICEGRLNILQSTCDITNITKIIELYKGEGTLSEDGISRVSAALRRELDIWEQRTKKSDRGKSDDKKDVAQDHEPERIVLHVPSSDVAACVTSFLTDYKFLLATMIGISEFIGEIEARMTDVEDTLLAMVCKTLENAEKGLIDPDVFTVGGEKEKGELVRTSRYMYYSGGGPDVRRTTQEILSAALGDDVFCRNVPDEIVCPMESDGPHDDMDIVDSSPSSSSPPQSKRSHSIFDEHVPSTTRLTKKRDRHNCPHCFRPIFFDLHKKIDERSGNSTCACEIRISDKEMLHETEKHLIRNVQQHLNGLNLPDLKDNLVGDVSYIDREIVPYPTTNRFSSQSKSDSERIDESLNSISDLSSMPFLAIQKTHGDKSFVCADSCFLPTRAHERASILYSYSHKI